MTTLFITLRSLTPSCCDLQVNERKGAFRPLTLSGRLLVSSLDFSAKITKDNFTRKRVHNGRHILRNWHTFVLRDHPRPSPIDCFDLGEPGRFARILKEVLIRLHARPPWQFAVPAQHPIGLPGKSNESDPIHYDLVPTPSMPLLSERQRVHA